jgi:hypothetical protein
VVTQHNIEGFYRAYFTGATGQSIGMFVFLDGKIVGADAGGGHYDGTFTVSKDNSKIIADVRFSMPVGGVSVTGASAGFDPMSVQMKLELPAEIQPHQVHRLETPMGPVNAKFEKIRSA